MVTARLGRILLLAACIGALGCGRESQQPASTAFDRDGFARQTKAACEQYRSIKKYRLVLNDDQYPREVRATTVLIDGLTQAAGASERPRSLTAMLDWLQERRARAQELERLTGGTDQVEPRRLQELVHDYLVMAGGRKPDPTRWERDLGIAGCTKAPIEAPRFSRDVDKRFEEALREAGAARQP